LVIQPPKNIVIVSQNPGFYRRAAEEGWQHHLMISMWLGNNANVAPRTTQREYSVRELGEGHPVYRSFQKQKKNWEHSNNLGTSPSTLIVYRTSMFLML
jgi:hypothetical protein